MKIVFSYAGRKQIQRQIKEVVLRGEWKRRTHLSSIRRLARVAKSGDHRLII